MSRSQPALARAESTPFGWLESWNPFSELFASPFQSRALEEFFGERLRTRIPSMPVDVTEADGQYVW